MKTKKNPLAFIATCAVSCAFTGVASADLIYHTALNTTSSISYTSSVVSLGANTFTDPDTGTVGSNVTYVGGTISLSGLNATSWAGGAFFFNVLAQNDTTVARLFGEDSGNPWNIKDSSNTGLSFGTLNSTFDFVLKFTDTAFNKASISVFLGADAIALTEPVVAPFGELINNNSSNPVSGLRINFTDNPGGTGAFTTSNMFSSTAWTPVGAPPPPSGTTFASGDIFSWTLNSDVNHDGTGVEGVRGADYTGLTTSSLSVASGAIFKVILAGTADVGTEFWNQTQTWDNIFDVSGTNQASLFDTFQVFSGETDITATTFATQGSFSMDGSSLKWTAVPEPSGAVAGLLLGAGLVRRRRA